MKHLLTPALLLLSLLSAHAAIEVTPLVECLCESGGSPQQAFLANQTKNFSGIIHNYSDKRKGFILWRDMLEEKLF
ncbi:MAG: hypothetical protein H6556_25125 [Lewinellaceae bacterium]|nr:hypothetical protein [Lewinellaceae bacterium]